MPLGFGISLQGSRSLRVGMFFVAEWVHFKLSLDKMLPHRTPSVLFFVLMNSVTKCFHYSENHQHDCASKHYSLGFRVPQG